MHRETMRTTAFAMPLTNPAFALGPHRFINREYFIIQYRTDPEALRRLVPELLALTEPVVNFEFIRMPDSTGFGDYTESSQVIPVSYQGQAGGFINQMFLNDHPPIASGRELWGFPGKLAQPSLVVETDTLVCTLSYGSVRIATGTMGYKHRTLDNLISSGAMQSRDMPGCAHREAAMRWVISFVVASVGRIAVALLVLFATNGFHDLGLDSVGVVALAAGITVASALGVSLMALIFLQRPKRRG